ncbi:LodA/GoxA family CTQ-dependent oxidase [Polaromonas sp. CG_9.11]|uniref:LodA/GoxA family CTQ-dependent oxidase n=1 Tax=Polaromonas sp. CG_9.11 TaxID=2787730 RepID=UPI0018C99798|nr:LodA/GoxA family CTQ-dependent oxidase [Polaromonas sp. CG_9.11]MBG6077809.1 hypothetical protein [Polaromonas sp. CG_9.11]
MIDENRIAYCKIFPPLGIARVGDSEEPNGYFFAPEEPGGRPRIAGGGTLGADFKYRDAAGAVKRQAALFHIYAFDSENNPLGELLASHAQVRWSVTLANKKAAWFKFAGAHGARSVFEGIEQPLDVDKKIIGIRNDTVGKLVRETGGPHGHRFVANPERKAQLEINAPELTVCGAGRRHEAGKEELQFVGKFRCNHEVYLGEIATDDEGRLIILGGRGVSAPVDPKGKLLDDPTNAWITHYANNENWFDDTADGPVTAEVTLATEGGNPGKRLEVRGGSWVVVAPPDFAPDTTNIVTLYDVMEEVAHDQPTLNMATTPAIRDAANPDLRLDIWPIIERSAGYRWVSKLGLRGHGQGRPGDGLNGEQVSFEKFEEAMNAEDGAFSKRLVAALRPPIYRRANGYEPSDAEMAEADVAATSLFMPPLSGDEDNRTPGKALTWLSLTYLQYERMKAWAVNPKCAAVGTAGQTEYRVLEDGSIHPSVMTKSLLDRCCGGAFYPGIEVTSIVRDPKLYIEAFRFDHSVLEPGDVTKYMALPWQADFFECQGSWWPAQRPDDVIHEDSFKKMFDEFEKTGTLAGTFEKALGERLLWTRGVGDASPRPGGDFLMSQVFPEVKEAESFEHYAMRMSEGWLKALINTVTEEDGASPWRERYLLQEACDRFAGRYFQPQVLEPESVLEFKDIKDHHPELVKRFNISSLPDLRQCWRDASRIDQEVIAKSLQAITKNYRKVMRRVLLVYLVKCIQDHPFDGGCANTKRSAHDFRKKLIDPDYTVSNLDKAYPGEVEYGRELFCEYVLIELRDALLDAAYLQHTARNGDNGMVQDWKNLGFVVRREMPLSNGKSLTVHVETERDKYQGCSYRDSFYYLLNIQEHQDFLPQAIRIANDALGYAATVIASTSIEDKNHPESFVPYSQPTFRAKLEEIYEIQRSRAQNFDIYFSARNRNLEDLVQGLTDLAPFNQCDGAWLRNISAAGPGDDVRALLFEVWSDEIGNGNALLHHGNLYTSLLNSYGVHTHVLNTRAYADDPKFHESSFVSPVFQFAISQHTDRYFPELLGMTLYLEWEVLSLVQGIKLYDYIGLDSHFWQMHVGIDNATNGHGAKARDAVISYLDRVRHEGGNEAVNEHWERIWRGFVAFAVVGNDVFGDDLGISRRRPGNPAAHLAEIMTRKANYGALNHLQHRLGKHRINDLFDDPNLFQKMMAGSKWIVPGDPDQSLFLKHLTTFQGPMYQIFDPKDLVMWRSWIEWLGRDGDTQRVKRYFDKSQAMEALLIELKTVAEGVGAHTRYKAVTENGKKSIAALFASDDVAGLMRALRAKDSGWVVSGDPAASPLIADLMRSTNLMAKALDRRFPTINNRIGRQIVIEWVRAGCPIPGETRAVPSKDLAPPLKPLGPSLYMHTLGIGAVH